MTNFNHKFTLLLRNSTDRYSERKAKFPEETILSTKKAIELYSSEQVS
jgi:hypothetical protein